MNRAVPTPTTARRSPSATLRLGYVPLLHAAPLLVARHLGFFAARGVNVRLSAEVGWATIREKIISGELDAAQALAPMPLAMSLGQNSTRCDCLTALVLTVHGDTIVLSRRLWDAIDGNPARLAEPRGASSEPRTFGVVFHHSAQHFLLREWLHTAGLMPDRDYRLVVVPPQQMVAHLKAGHIDGCCLGEPWGSLAVKTGVGIVAALSAELAPGHPEKVLLVRRSFATTRADEHRALVLALLDACAWCAHPDHQAELGALLSRRDALGLPIDILNPALGGRFDLGGGRFTQRPDVVLFHGPGINEPTVARASWLAAHFQPSPPPELLHRTYDASLFRAFTSAPITQPAHDNTLPSLADSDSASDSKSSHDDL